MEKYLKLAELVATNNGDMKVNSGVDMKGDVDTHRGKNMDNVHPPRENGDLSLNKMPMGEVPENKIDGALPASGNGIPSKKVEGSLPAKKAEAENQEEINLELVKIAAALGNAEAIKMLEPAKEKTASETNPHKKVVEDVFKLAQAGVAEAYDFLVKMETLMPGLADDIIK